ncbi:unnamed protein product [Darwinula stevensoni]|uniref:VPS9 domain-containing protein n=1 Tax=Darwinula stevensoni TaxID=69355 RepID=A0A7R9A1V9_9CRUS|nr:unnamed protein product [Darwinula stevensoni]CAG0887427.1 unnamed protein product [Darwinula stevensoni]
MMEQYDEDINKNEFFIYLKTQHPWILTKCIEEGWIICVPKKDSLPQLIREEDLFSNILVDTSDKFIGQHFRSLTDQNVTLKGNQELEVFVKHPEGSQDLPPTRIRILFREVFYDETQSKCDIWCIDEPLQSEFISSFSLEAGNCCETTKSLGIPKTFQECTKFLQSECSSKSVMKKVEELVKEFQRCHSKPVTTVGTLQFLVSKLLSQVLHHFLYLPQIREKFQSNSQYGIMLKVCIETYVIHELYDVIIDGILLSTAAEDSDMNRAIHDCCDIQLEDLNIREEFHRSMHKARGDFLIFQNVKTPWEKMLQLCSLIQSLKSEAVEAVFLSADDILPILVFLIVKSSFSHWITLMMFLKHFQFFSNTGVINEPAYYLTSLEAALEHVQGRKVKKDLHALKLLPTQFQVSKDTWVHSYMKILWSAIVEGSMDEIESVLRDFEAERNRTVKEFAFCHPLCNCEGCQKMHSLSDTWALGLLSVTDEDGHMPLHVASMMGRVGIVELLVNLSGDVNAREEGRGRTPLHMAAQFNHQNILLFLLYSKADLNAQDFQGMTPLMLATFHGNENCVKALLYYAEHTSVQFRIDAQDIHGDTALHIAVRWGFQGIVSLLLDAGANVSVANLQGKLPKDSAHNLHIRTLIVDHEGKFSNANSVFIQAHTGSHSTAHMKLNHVCTNMARMQKTMEKCFQAIVLGDINLACFYLGIEPLQKGKKKEGGKCHPLCSCSQCACNTSVSKVNGESPMTINSANSEGYTALHMAALYDQKEILQTLLHNGANKETKTRQGMTPLHVACQCNLFNIAEILLDDEADPTYQDRFGNTPLHYACIMGHVPLVKKLIEKGGWNLHMNVNKRTPLEEGRLRGNVEVVHFLESLPSASS